MHGGQSSTTTLQDSDSQDRLSALPDALLIEILNLLEIKFAASTSVLSRRWIRLWTHHTGPSFHVYSSPSSSSSARDSLCYIYNPLLPYYVSFETFERIFSQFTTSDKLYSFTLELEQPRTIWETCAMSWFPKICARNPEILFLNFPAYVISHGEGGLVSLPNCLFQTNSLAKLILKCCYHKEKFMLPDFTSDVAFPSLSNLKTLDIDIDDQNPSQLMRLVTLFKCCPLLEDLKLRLYPRIQIVPFGNEHEISAKISLIAPNLKVLEVFRTNTRNRVNIEFAIDAPMLQDIKLKNWSLMLYHFITIPCSLMVVDLDLEGWESNLAKDSLNDLFRGISNTRSLIIGFYTLHVFNLVNTMGDVFMEGFGNLNHLKIAPFLTEGDEMIWGNVFPCYMLTNLRSVEMEDLRLVSIELELLQYILKHASLLEQLRVSLFREYDEEWNKYQTLEEYEYTCTLFSMTRTSLSCMIEFDGGHYTASSKEFDNDLPFIKYLDRDPFGCYSD